MIPTIEDIVAGLLAGTYTREQAIGWLHEHRKLAALPAPEAVSDEQIDRLVSKWFDTCKDEPGTEEVFRRRMRAVLLAARSTRDA